MASNLQASICDALLDAFPMSDKIADNCAAIAAKVAAARIIALEEALRPFGVIADAVISEAPADATKAKLWNGADNLPLFISLDACRRARAALGDAS